MTARIITVFLPFTLVLACNDKDSTDDGTIDDTIYDPGEQDNDGDGFTTSDGDCDDENSAFHPAAEEICDGIDNNCDGEIDEGVTNTFYADTDDDGFGDEGSTVEACDSPDGYVAVGGDCDDTTAESFPGNVEYCDGVDNDCDGDIDEDVQETFWADGDGDGYGDPDSVIETCEEVSGYVANSDDCDDTSSISYPLADEICDELDNDCDGTVDEGVTDTYYADVDGDTYGVSDMTTEACDLPTGYSDIPGDCDDAVAAINPDALEECDTVDNDCDGTIDEDDAIDALTWYRDNDTDGYGESTLSTLSCTQPPGYVADATDCDDGDAAQYPGADEYCNTEDDDCDGTIDEDDSLDVLTWYADSDSDTYGDASSSDIDCNQPSGYVADATDCDDGDAAQYPGADEYCNTEDDDCDGDIDEEAVDGDWYATDDDSDGFGAEGSTQWVCDGVTNELDCDDADSGEPVVTDPVSGSSSGAGTITDPLDSLQDAIDSAGECVVAMAGTYYEAIDFYGNEITVTGFEGADYTTIDASGIGAPAVTLESGESAAAVLSGFTLTGGDGYEETVSTSYACTSITTCTDYYTTYCGGGLYLSAADPTIEDVVVTINALEPASTTASGDDVYYVNSYGGGLCAMNSAATLTRVDFIENFADQGGGIYIDEDSNITLDQSWVIANTAGSGGGISVDTGYLTVTNMASMWNEADYDGGGILVASGTLVSTNVTHAGDDATDGGGMYIDSGTATVMNTIVYDSTGDGIYGTSATFSGSYNNVYSNTSSDYSGITDPTGSSGNISADPDFASWSDDGNYSNDDISLGSSSNSTDAGNSSSVYDDTDGTTNDQGAWGGPGGDW